MTGLPLLAVEMADIPVGLSCGRACRLVGGVTGYWLAAIEDPLLKSNLTARKCKRWAITHIDTSFSLARSSLKIIISKI
jgi:hypothetical protein